MSVDTAPWSVSADEMPADGSPVAQFEFLLRYAILAPSWLKAKLGQLVVTHLDIGDRQAANDSVLVESTPAVVVLGSTADTPGVRVRVGQTFERLALTATVHGLSVHPMSQALELPDLRAALADTLGASEGVVQHLFRLGYANESEPKASRRPLSAVVR